MEEHISKAVQRLAYAEAIRMGKALTEFYEQHNLSVLDHYRIVVEYPDFPCVKLEGKLLSKEVKFRIKLNKRSKLHYLRPFYYFFRSRAYRHGLILYFLGKVRA